MSLSLVRGAMFGAGSSWEHDHLQSSTTLLVNMDILRQCPLHRGSSQISLKQPASLWHFSPIKTFSGKRDCPDLPWSVTLKIGSTRKLSWDSGMVHTYNPSTWKAEIGAHCEFQGSLSYIASSRPDETTSWVPGSKDLEKTPLTKHTCRKLTLN